MLDIYNYKERLNQSAWIIIFFANLLFPRSSFPYRLMRDILRAESAQIREARYNPAGIRYELQKCQ